MSVDRPIVQLQEVTRRSMKSEYRNTSRNTSSVTSFIRYKISYTQTILVIMVLRYCNLNIFNDFERFSIL